ncbi:Stp1/IreP family PP2C-type Ser/Thr phosphatase [Gorillibacterium timonense]|uniref:Stp1/IreP family PP2C-type Ser/Thr phosphatase n=1 Tax=Gorillibacterium timonense TaxID=1689269 RepID=UPI00071E3E22|nr:Stp1/IreP family PP2C-type Ser/Thr phosphatase [Gorillibacterium timonense]
MRTASRTDIGNVRVVNEDRALVVPELQGLTLAIVADGMGGHQAGDTASQLAVELIHERLHGIEPDEPSAVNEEKLAAAIASANTRIYEMARSQEQFNGMGTTVVVVLADANGLLVAHIGDSRAYLYQDGKLAQLTEDHSLVYELVRSGQLTKEEAEKHPRRNVLIRALGTDASVNADIRYYPWKPGDIALLCSDGLSGMISEPVIEQLLGAGRDLEKTADSLVELALAEGGDDNITVVLLENAPAEPAQVGG